MVKANNTIEINGHLYDATTGARISGVKKTIKSAGQSVGKFVDGYRAQAPKKANVTKPSAAKTANRTAAKRPVAPQKPAAKAVPKTARTSSPNVHHNTKRSLTLHRSAVKKPALAAPKAATPAAPKIESSSLKHSDDSRAKRAAAVTKSSAISRFQKFGSEFKSPPATKKSAEEKSSAATTPTHTKEQLLRHAAASTSVHQTSKKAPKNKKHRIGRYLTTAAVAVILAAYVAYLNVPGISMKVAAHRAGFAATMPGYKPAGYSFNGPISYTSGQVTVNFSSNTDSRQFSLKQQPTTWDSTALVENYVTKQSPNYLTYQDRGLTIYIYNGSSAAWVNAGKLYTIDGKNSELNTDQMLKVATNV